MVTQKKRALIARFHRADFAVLPLLVYTPTRYTLAKLLYYNNLVFGGVYLVEFQTIFSMRARVRKLFEKRKGIHSVFTICLYYNKLTSVYLWWGYTPKKAGN
jgi:hypothetical protein